MNKTLVYVLIAVALLAVAVLAWQSMSGSSREFIEIDPNGPRPSEPPPGMVSGPGGGMAAPQPSAAPASGLPTPPGKGGR